MCSFRKYVRDKVYVLLLALGVWVMLGLFLLALHTTVEILIVVSVAWWGCVIGALAIEYGRRRRFYRSLLENLRQLDQAYLVLEMLEVPDFYEGKLLYDVLYQVDKSAAEKVQEYRLKTGEFQEYVEMWIHEVKTPLAALALIAREPKINEQIKYLDDYVEQVLYFARAENAERDYLIGRVVLEEVVGKVLNRNREVLQARKIKIVTKSLDGEVRTDAKWLEFMISQIINNSVKYGSKKIELSAEQEGKETRLKIRDDGIGIEEKDLPRVFEKSFTGKNGRQAGKATGMGLYIVRTLCGKLGHEVEIQSQAGEFTEVTMRFGEGDFYEVTKK